MDTAVPRLDAPLDELLAYADERYGTTFEPLATGDIRLEFLQIKDMPGQVDKAVAESNTGEKVKLPFWACIWPTALLLSYFVQRLPAGERTMLEIGAGVGVAGLFAAAHGIRTTITDIHPDALVFARVNVLKNGLQDRAEVVACDFSADRLGRRFDYILGSEILYIDDLCQGLVKFLLAHLERASHAEVILGRDFRRKADHFLRLAEEKFTREEKTIGCKADDPEFGIQRHQCSIYRLRPRKTAVRGPLPGLES